MAKQLRKHATRSISRVRGVPIRLATGVERDLPSPARALYDRASIAFADRLINPADFEQKWPGLYRLAFPLVASALLWAGIVALFTRLT